MANTSVFSVNDLGVKISTAGRTLRDNDYSVIRGMESVSVTFDNGIEEWNPLDARGWVRRMGTTKSMTVAFSGKRVSGCPANDYIATLAYQTGTVLNTNLWIDFPNGAWLVMECVINVTACEGGSGGDVGVLEFECLSDGIPMYMDRVGRTITNRTIAGGFSMNAAISGVENDSAVDEGGADSV